ncbi:UDP-N-acetylglucosamine 2-epimerase [Candidatus Woesebacteria bacterium]|nr:UDP-N-acetylglucosamine 2-epimerase [Candidatus Woesebacteria bacterium]
MTKKDNFYFFIGTTAELIKLFPVIREFESRKIDFKIITSGQTKINFNEVGSWIKKTKPDIVLPGKVNESSIFVFLIWAFRTLLNSISLHKEFKSLNREHTYLIVHGDTVSSLIGAMISKFYRTKLVHIESGLRSFNFLEPFPEEISRFIISHIADIHFCPNQWSMDNLKNIGGIKINTMQNTLIESFNMAINKNAYGYRKLVGRGKYFVFVLHRQEHVIFRKQESKELVEFVFRHAPENIKCVFITHVTTRDFLSQLSDKTLVQIGDKLVFQPRLPYVEFMHLLNNAEFLITDGGSNQEESYYMGLPCLIVRSCTERIEGLGKNAVLAKYDKRLIKIFLENYRKYRGKQVKAERPSKIIVDNLTRN